MSVLDQRIEVYRLLFFKYENYEIKKSYKFDKKKPSKKKTDKKENVCKKFERKGNEKERSHKIWKYFVLEGVAQIQSRICIKQADFQNIHNIRFLEHLQH